AAYPLADPTLVNDLDLIVTVPEGTEYKGNIFSNGFSTFGGSFDRLNNVEVVWLQAPQTGIYNITVRGYNVPSNGVPFALAISGGTSGTIEPPDGEEPEVKYLKVGNPFVDETQIQLLLTDTSNVNLTIYDVLGRKIIDLLNNQTIEPGSDPVTWGSNVKPGIYFAVLEIDGEKVDEEKIIKIAR
ncbi:MAG: T9SS type A sorting domain-containing protein, partial [candidate division WOR-3 bacterium]